MTINGNVTVNGDVIEAGGQKTVTYHIDRVDHLHTTDGKPSIEQEDPITALFDTLTHQAVKQHTGEWKEILKPYRSAIDAGAMDQCFTREQFNQRFGVEVPASPFSRWLMGNQEQYQYKNNENGAMIAQFEALKNGRE